MLVNHDKMVVSEQDNNMNITFWGTRGSIASPGPETVIFGGNTTCLEITLASGRTVVIDAGTGIRKLGDALLQRPHPVELYLLMTHVHWDHLIGFPFFGPLFHDNCRITLDGTRKGLDGLKAVFSSKSIDGTWPISFQDLRARIDVSHQLSRGKLVIDDTVVEQHPLQHPQGGMGFRFTESSRSFVFLTDNELREDGWRGTRFKDFVRFCRNADLLIHDCQYLPEEMGVRLGWGHSDLESVTRLALEAGVERLLLFHHDPWRTDKGVSGIIDRCRDMLDQAKRPVEVDAAREGITVSV